MPEKMLTLYQPVDTSYPTQPCHTCGYTRFSVIRIEQAGYIPLDIFGGVTQLGGAGGFLVALDDGVMETRRCLRCAQDPDEEPLPDETPAVRACIVLHCANEAREDPPSLLCEAHFQIAREFSATSPGSGDE